MKKIMTLVLVASVVVLNLVMLDVNVWVAIVLVLGGLGFGLAADACGEKKSPKRTISLSKAARQQRELARA